MSQLTELLNADSLAPALDTDTANKIAKALGDELGIFVYPASLTASGKVLFLMGLEGIQKYIVLVYADGTTPTVLADFSGKAKSFEIDGVKCQALIAETSEQSGEGLRKNLSFTAPILLGIKKSAGLGDRLGLAGPGHIRSVLGTNVLPILAQQSIRELSRTQRTAIEVMDCATFSCLQEGYRDGFGSDADHLKTTEDIDYTAAAHYTMFTIDPSEFVETAADTDSLDVLDGKYKALPFDELKASADEYKTLYVGIQIEIEAGFTIQMSEEEFLRAAVKYSKAVCHTVMMDTHLKKVRGDNYELEMSVDETDTPTTIAEHFFFANELKRLGVTYVSLAPRFIGEFEKGVDYKGDLDAFEESFKKHIAIAKYFGGYKISLHSGSDKFSVYPIAGRVGGELIHLKTAGTSYLEALAVMAKVKPEFFRKILGFCIPLYETEKKTYHVSAQLSKVKTPDQLSDDELVGVVYEFDTRQVLHVTFGKVLTEKDADGAYLFRTELLRTLRENEEIHYQALDTWLKKHIEPLATK